MCLRYSTCESEGPNVSPYIFYLKGKQNNEENNFEVVGTPEVMKRLDDKARNDINHAIITEFYS